MKRGCLHRLVLAVISVFLLVTQSYVSAQVDTFEFDNDEQQSRFRQLSDELRCPMCQNTNLSGSTGGVAEDLRREIHRMILEGLSNEEIEQFMFERYGDFIFYRPRLRAETILLWFGPLVFLIIGGFVAYSIFRRANSVDQEAVGLDEEQEAKLNELVGK
tara:strand:- start:788 stop:1267 length:480 start_codon:yes stop_codon:yes gene_type:complete